MVMETIKTLAPLTHAHFYTLCILSATELLYVVAIFRALTPKFIFKHETLNSFNKRMLVVISVVQIYLHILLSHITALSVGQDSAVGIATRYGLDGLWIKSWWRRDFPHPSRQAVGPTQPPIQWVPGLSQEWSDRSVALTTNPYLAPRLNKEWIYISTPPSGLSWPVLLWTSLLPALLIS